MSNLPKEMEREDRGGDEKEEKGDFNFEQKESLLKEENFSFLFPCHPNLNPRVIRFLSSSST